MEAAVPKTMMGLKMKMTSLLSETDTISCSLLLLTERAVSALRRKEGEEVEPFCEEWPTTTLMWRQRPEKTGL